MESVSAVFGVWGSAAAFAADLQIPYPTAASWKRRGSIPPDYWQRVIAAAARRDVSLTIEMLANMRERARRPVLHKPRRKAPAEGAAA